MRLLIKNVAFLFAILSGVNGTSSEEKEAKKIIDVISRGDMSIVDGTLLENIETVMGMDEHTKEDFELDYGLKRRIVTYNADLSPTTCAPSDLTESQPSQCSYADRRDKQIELINNDQYLVDVMCLQGIWYRKDAALMIKETKGQFPYSYSFLHESEKSFSSPCTPEDSDIIQFLAMCEYNMCYMYSAIEELFACIEENCGIDLMRYVSADCISCFFLGTVNNPAIECSTPEYAFNPTGLLLLSKSKLSEQKRDFYGVSAHELIRRGYLDVKVDGIGRIVCTQLTEYLGKDYVEITNDFTSYEIKNKFEMERLLELVKDTPKVIIAGDLNISPELWRGGDIASQFAHNFDKAMLYGFSDPVTEHFEDVTVPCSVCYGNPMMHKRYPQEHENSDGFVFDHILVRGFNISRLEVHKLNPDVFRVFQETIDGNEPLSSHYGQLVTIRTGGNIP